MTGLAPQSLLDDSAGTPRNVCGQLPVKSDGQHEVAFEAAIVPREPLERKQRSYKTPITVPPTAQRMTTSQGGVCHMNSSRNAAMASAKSAAPDMPLVHTGR